MALLNPDLFFDIGKQLIEDGDAEAVIRFALSGKGPCKVMKKLFSTVTILKIGWYSFAIGWNNSRCYVFKYRNTEPPMKFLLHQIGNFVKELHIDYGNIAAYRPVLDKIIAKKQLITFSSSCDDDFLLLDNFFQILPVFSSTLKNLKIPYWKMTTAFWGTLNLDSLNVFTCIPSEDASFCCKTKLLEVDCISDFADPSTKLSLFTSSVKQLIGNETSDTLPLTVDKLNGIMHNFSSLEILKYNVSLYNLLDTDFFRDHIRWFKDFVANTTKVPSKATYSFTLHKLTNKPIAQTVLDDYKNLCPGFEYDQTISDFWCFRKVLQSAGTQSTIFEIHFAKKVSIST